MGCKFTAIDDLFVDGKFEKYLLSRVRFRNSREHGIEGACVVLYKLHGLSYAISSSFSDQNTFYSRHVVIPYFPNTSSSMTLQTLDSFSPRQLCFLTCLSNLIFLTNSTLNFNFQIYVALTKLQSSTFNSASSTSAQQVRKTAMLVLCF